MKKICLAVTILLLASCATGSPIKDPRWGRIKTPSAPPTASIGTYNAGCIGGAQAMPMEGVGYQIMRPSRNRYYGHPNLVHFIENLGQVAATEGARLSIGDMAQPRGGPMRSGHASHQIGLDADIWYWRSPQLLNTTQRENISASSLVRRNGTLKENAWQPYYRHLLQQAAQMPEVERIFVHAAIKKKLCETAAGEPWLRKIRPWWGHDAHFHVRLRCPAGESHCKNQPPAPEGDGCNALDWWLKKQPADTTTETQPEAPAAPLMLPAACEALVSEETL